jgi:hypothetical protein
MLMEIMGLHLPGAMPAPAPGSEACKKGLRSEWREG